MDIEVQFTANINQEENGVDLAKYIINLGVCLVEQEVVDIETEITKSIRRRPAFVQKGIVDILQINFTTLTVFAQVLWYIFHRRFHNESSSKRRRSIILLFLFASPGNYHLSKTIESNVVIWSYNFQYLLNVTNVLLTSYQVIFFYYNKATRTYSIKRLK